MQRQGLLWNMQVESVTEWSAWQRSTSADTSTNKYVSVGDVENRRVLGDSRRKSFRIAASV